MLQHGGSVLFKRHGAFKSLRPIGCILARHRRVAKAFVHFTQILELIVQLLKIETPVEIPR